MIAIQLLMILTVSEGSYTQDRTGLLENGKFQFDTGKTSIPIPKFGNGIWLDLRETKQNNVRGQVRKT